MKESTQIWKPDTCRCVLQQVKIHTISEDAVALSKARETLSKLRSLVIAERSKVEPIQAQVDQLLTRIHETEERIASFGTPEASTVEVDESRTTILWGCADHASVSLDELPQIVMNENRSKNQALSRADRTKWHFDGTGRNRVVVID